MTNPKGRINPFLKGLKNLIGVGIYLLVIGVILEALTIIALQWVSFPISLSIGMQITLSVPCILCCLSGMIWFNKTLNLVKIHFAGGENKLMTDGPFNYVRHPLYAALLISLPPLLLIWYADILFVVTWALIFISAHFMILVEEKGLIRIFGEEYETYKKYVPGLLPYKGAGGMRYRQHLENVKAENSSRPTLPLP